MTNTHAVWNVRFLNQIMDSMAEGVFTMDVQGRITSWNRAMEKISGYPASQALGQSCALLGFSKCFGRLCPKNIHSCGIMEYGYSEPKECVLRHKQGRDVPVIKQARVVRDEKEQIIGIVETLTDVSELEKARQKAEEANRLLTRHYSLHNIIGQSPAMQEVFHRLQAAAASRANVLIQGESGTGKELIASAIHYNSEVANQPFVTVNSSALSETLLESELFGHARGSFTGAHKDRRGRFEEAHGGSIFLDEIGELSPAIQVKLLRVLQEREIERVGESRPRKVDIRVISASNQDLKELVSQAGFRQDLYYRLNVFPVLVPPLRHRKEDIPLLVSHFIQQQNQQTGKDVKGIQQQGLRLLMDYPWPGNVRELENAIQHAFVLCEKELLRPEDLPREIRSGQSGIQTTQEPREQIQAPGPSKAGSLNREELWQLLRECNWNKAEAARHLGVSRTAIWKYMKKWNIPLQKPES
ncbi:MAG: sigma-54 interaction domain-containing protein [Thermodesulfobacteriota bacterium]